MDKIMLYGGLFLGLCSFLSVVFHVLNLQKAAAIDDKIVSVLQQLGVKPPQA